MGEDLSVTFISSSLLQVMVCLGMLLDSMEKGKYSIANTVIPTFQQILNWENILQGFMRGKYPLSNVIFATKPFHKKQTWRNTFKVFMKEKKHSIAKVFTANSYLKNHISGFHERGKEFKCIICNKVFKSSSGRDQHWVSIHEGKRPFRCKTCHSTFFSAQILRGHTAAVHEGKRKLFKCTICDKSLTWQKDLNKHIQTVHEGKKPYDCKSCNSNFTNKESLKRHALVHEGNKQFRCKNCSSSFYSRGEVKVHSDSVHEGKKPFSCIHCSASFSHKGNLTKHLRVSHFLGQRIWLHNWQIFLVDTGIHFFKKLFTFILNWIDTKSSKKLLCLKLFCHFGKNKQMRVQFQTKKISRNLSSGKSRGKTEQKQVLLTLSFTTFPASSFDINLKTMDEKILKYSDLNSFIVLRFFIRSFKTRHQFTSVHPMTKLSTVSADFLMAA